MKGKKADPDPRWDESCELIVKTPKVLIVCKNGYDYTVHIRVKTGFMMTYRVPEMCHAVQNGVYKSVYNACQSGVF
ncbi:MAG: hypothetical protein UW09_C0001G0015 [candidate division TM6 bacterium GW2011_GWF2_43_87]|nr:MAG: hypothetical protein UW09_C0001G0015 [candidate division TM6 bacterium GW2011_GWF2_43_87]